MSKVNDAKKVFAHKNILKGLLATSFVGLAISVAPQFAPEEEAPLALPPEFIDNATDNSTGAQEDYQSIEISGDSWGESQSEVEEIQVELDPPPPPPPPVVVQERPAAPASRSNQREVVNNPAPPSVAGNAVLEIAAQYVGVPYVYGGNDASGLDCSGFTKLVYGELGINLPRSSAEQKNAGVVVSSADALPGDLVWTPGHIAIYAGDGMIIDAPRPGKTVQFRQMYQSNPTFIRVS